MRHFAQLIALLLAGTVWLHGQTVPAPPSAAGALLFESSRCDLCSVTCFIDMRVATDKLESLKNINESLCLLDCPGASSYAQGYSALQLGNLQLASEALDQAHAENADRPYLEFARGLLLSRQKQTLEALAVWEPLLKEQMPCDLEARLFNNLGTVSFSRSDHSAALDNYERAWDAACECEEAVAIRGAILQNLAMMHLAEHDYQGAIHEYEALLNAASTPMRRVTRAKILSNLGSSYESAGRYFDALNSLKQSAALLEDGRDDGALSSSLYNLALVYIQLGMLNQAEETLNRAIAIMKKRGDQARLAMALGSLGLVAYHREDQALAEATFKESIALAKAQGDTLTEISSQTNLGNMFSKVGQDQKALDAYEKALMMSQERNQRYDVAVAQINMSDAALSLGDPDKALDLLSQAETFAVESASLGLQWDILWLQARAYWEKGEAERSLGLYRRAVGILNDLRRSLKAEEVQKAYTSKVIEVYEDYLDKLLFLFQQEHGAAIPETAFGVVEMKKAQILRDFLAEAGVDRPRPSDFAGLASLQRLLANEKALFLSFSLGEKGSHLILVSPMGVTMYPLPPERQIAGQVRSVLAVLAGGTGEKRAIEKLRYLAEPVFSHKGVRKLIISPDGILHRLPFDVLTDGRGRYLVEDYAIQVAPSAAVLEELRAAPAGRGHGVLALGNPDFSGCLPVQTILMETGIKLPPLPFAEEEARRVAQLVPGGGTALTGPDASEAAVSAERGGPVRVLHFATHGIVEEQSPQGSGLVLSAGGGEDGYLAIPEILELSLPCDLVALSACDTGRGEIAKGEGLFGFSRAFLYAGAKDVLVALWKINDLAAARLMESFYGQMGRGVPADQALRLAKLDLIHNGVRLEKKDLQMLQDSRGAGEDGAPTVMRGKRAGAVLDASAPVFWAPFVLIGR